MRHITGIGGSFFTASDPAALRAWYARHLGIDVQAWGGAALGWADAAGSPTTGTTIRSIAADAAQFAPGASPFMVNHRVENLHAFLRSLREEGCDVLEQTDDSGYGKLGWVMGPEGNKVGLWQPPAGR